ncbi:glycyl-radical enzyme activating protein [Puteibacter caeruleilacunae]|nr:glycyl-radical enzyme activating protein [Puteibacter caeruleilacunae]
MEGKITTIQRLSIHDGPGIRSTIFMKGCNLRCQWCHNPETFSMQPQLQWISEKCINCGKCVEVCNDSAFTINNGLVQFNRDKCTTCFDCVEHCYPNAIQQIGRTISADDLFNEIAPDFPYFNTSNGGVTFSGGEPMLQLNFLLKTLQLFKQANIHTAIETNFTADWSKYEAIIPYVDLFIGDLKIMDSKDHKRWTGLGNDIILKNIKKLDKTGIPYYIRTPIIPGVNHSAIQVESIIQFVSDLNNVERFELLPYHPLADVKYRNLGIKNPLQNTKGLTNKDLEIYNPILKQYNPG